MLYASIAIIFNEEKKVLVLKRSAELSSFPNKWSFPGGTAEAGETSIQCLIREVHEETSLTLKEKLVTYFYSIKREDGKEIDFYISNKPPGEIELDWESSEYKWIEVEDLSNLDFLPSKDDIFKLVQSWKDINLA